MIGNNLNTATTPAELATLWCYQLTRRKYRMPADHAEDITPEFENLVGLGFAIPDLRAEIMRPGRDRSEYMWQFRKRLLEQRQANGAVAGRTMSALERRLREGNGNA